jgi:hypothetical protein
MAGPTTGPAIRLGKSPTSMTKRHQVAITLALGFILITAVLGVILLQAPDDIISTNSVTVTQPLGLFDRHAKVCQATERLPASTEALRISLIGYFAPAVSVTVSHGGQFAASGRHNAGWFGGALTLPLHPAVITPLDAKICLTRGPGGLPIELAGNVASTALAATANGQTLPGRMRIEYLRSGHRSWLSLARHVARRLGLGHSPSGTWIVLPLLAVMAMATALGAWLLLREARDE